MTHEVLAFYGICTPHKAGGTLIALQIFARNLRKIAPYVWQISIS